MNDMINTQITAESLFEYRQDDEAELISDRRGMNGIATVHNSHSLSTTGNSISYCSTMEVCRGKQLYIVPTIPPFIDSWRFFNRDVKRVFSFWDQYTQARPLNRGQCFSHCLVLRFFIDSLAMITLNLMCFLSNFFFWDAWSMQAGVSITA